MNNSPTETLQEQAIEKYRDLGYNDDLLPVKESKRSWNTLNYFTLWMGSAFNVPNYLAVGGFLFLGLSPLNIIIAITISSLAVAAIMILNGVAGTKYGIPFSILLRASYGEKGAQLPGFLRGCVAAIMWYGLQTYTGSQALLILIGRFIPSFMNLGGSFSLLGLSLPSLIAFLAFWVMNLFVGLGGGAFLKKFTAILNPMIYIVFGGMTIWAIRLGGGIKPILNFTPQGEVQSNPALLVYLIIISSVLSVWAAPAVSVSDFTKNAKSVKSQMTGQISGLFVSYLLFALSSVCVLIGASIKYNTDMWNVLDIINKWDSGIAIAFASIVLLMTTISTNATGNIVPAAYQLASLAPKQINYKRGVIIASVISILICPWKMVESASSIYLFLDVIGAIVGPVSGVMIAHYFILAKQTLNLDKLYGVNPNEKLYPRGVNNAAFIATILAVFISLIGKIVPALSVLASLSWMIGFASAFILYVAISKVIKNQ